MQRLIHKKQLNNITAVEFTEKEIIIHQEADYVILYKDELLKIAQLLENEKRDQEFYKNRSVNHVNN